MRFLRGVKGQTGLDRFRNDDIRREVNTMFVNYLLTCYRVSWRAHVETGWKNRDYHYKGSRKI